MMKKIGALVLAIMMIAMVGIAGAVGENTGSSDYNGSTGHPYAQQDDNSFSIKKEILLFNVDNSQILDPNVVYTYTVSAVNVTDGETTVTGYVLGDNSKTTSAVVKDGISGAVTIQGRKENAITGHDGAAATVTGEAGTTTTITFGGDNGTKHTTKDEGASIASSDTQVTTGYIDVSVNEAAIYAAGKGPGIYRYKISDTTAPETLTASGITRQDNYITDLYLDIYVKNNTSNDGYKVYGYVLFKEGATPGVNTDLDILFSSGTSESVKVDGYTVLSEVSLVDSYHTYNVEVSKTTTGDLADKRNNFPFQVDLTNIVITSQDDFYYVITKDGSKLDEVKTSLANNGSKTIGSASSTVADNLALQDGDKILITGLPVSTKIDVTEYNNTYDLYTASAKDESEAVLNMDNTVASGAAASDVASVPLATIQTASIHTLKDIDYTDSKDIVAITNNIETISPTGYVARIAPYALILIAGIALLIVAKKRKPAKEEE
jgi:hypothetical protein